MHQMKMAPAAVAEAVLTHLGAPSRTVCIQHDQEPWAEKLLALPFPWGNPALEEIMFLGRAPRFPDASFVDWALHNVLTKPHAMPRYMKYYSFMIGGGRPSPGKTRRSGGSGKTWHLQGDALERQPWAVQSCPRKIGSDRAARGAMRPRAARRKRDATRRGVTRSGLTRAHAEERPRRGRRDAESSDTEPFGHIAILCVFYFNVVSRFRSYLFVAMLESHVPASEPLSAAEAAQQTLQPFYKLTAHKLTSFGSKFLGRCPCFRGFRPFETGS